MKDEIWKAICPYVLDHYNRADLELVPDNQLLAAAEFCKACGGFSPHVKIVPYEHLSGQLSESCGVIHEEIMDEVEPWIEGYPDTMPETMGLGEINMFNRKYGIFVEPYAGWGFGIFEA